MALEYLKLGKKGLKFLRNCKTGVKIKLGIGLIHWRKSINKIFRNELFSLFQINKWDWRIITKIELNKWGDYLW